MKAKYVKRLAVLAAMSCMIVSLTACGGDSSDTSAKEEAAEEEPEEESAEEEPETEAEPAAEEESAESYEAGVLTETSYESRFLNMKFTAPDGYVMATAEELGNVIDAGTESLNEEGQAATAAAVADSTNEMMVANPNGMPSVAIITEKLPLINLTEEQYLDAAKQSFTEYQDEINYEVPEENAAKVIAGSEYKGFVADAEYQGIEIVQEFWVRKVADRMALVTITYTADMAEDVEQLMANFVAYE